jgi:ribonucleoside-diphosphate reductase alpha chain
MSILCEKFKGTRFEPSGFTGNPEVPMATSIMDYLFRWLAIRFNGDELHPAARAAAGQLDLPGVPVLADEEAAEGSGQWETAAPRIPAIVVEKSAAARGFVSETDAPPCHECGTLMVRNGACHKCPNCGATSGCS